MLMHEPDGLEFVLREQPMSEEWHRERFTEQLVGIREELEGRIQTGKDGEEIPLNLASTIEHFTAEQTHELHEIARLSGMLKKQNRSAVRVENKDAARIHRVIRDANIQGQRTQHVEQNGKVPKEGLLARLRKKAFSWLKR